MKLFIDTSALVALRRKDDAQHARAKEFLLQAGAVEFHTCNLTFSETLTLLAARHGQDAAIDFGTDFMAVQRMKVYYADATLERAGLAVLRAFRDKRLSFVDAATIALVRAERLDGVFGFDADFERCGVRLYP